MRGSSCENQGRPLALSPMGSTNLQDDGCGNASPEKRDHEEEPGHSGEQHSVSRCPLGVQSTSQPAITERAGTCGTPVEDAGELASRRHQPDPAQHDWPECLEPPGSKTEAMHSSALSVDHHGTPRPEELVIPANGDGLSFVLSQIMLANPDLLCQRHCYGNSLGPWGADSLQLVHVSEKHTELAVLLSASMIEAENLVTLLPGLFGNWNGNGPADASEFALHSLTWCQPQCLLGTWSRRLDTGKLSVPITLQNDTSARDVTLQFLLDAWTQEHGMWPFDQPFTLMRLQVDRFYLDSAENFAFRLMLDIASFLFARRLLVNVTWSCWFIW